MGFNKNQFKTNGNVHNDNECIFLTTKRITLYLHIRQAQALEWQYCTLCSLPLVPLLSEILLLVGHVSKYHVNVDFA